MGFLLRIFCVMYYSTNTNKDFKLPFTSIEIAKTNRPCGLKQKNMIINVNSNYLQNAVVTFFIKIDKIRNKMMHVRD